MTVRIGISRSGTTMADAIELVAAERRRQKEVEGYTFRHDVEEHQPRELEAAARCYWLRRDGVGLPAEWPWAPQFWKPKDRRRNLERAGALILAAIETTNIRCSRSRSATR